MKLDAVCQVLSRHAPLSLAESWDNVGLLLGDRSSEVSKLMTCLTVTPSVVEEAVEQGVDLVITHHPIPFRPLSRLTSDSITGALLWRLIGAGVAVYSAHTAFDSAERGINQRWAESLGLQSIDSIIEPSAGTEQNADPSSFLGAGRYGELSESMTARDVIARCGQLVTAATPLRAVGDLDRSIRRVGFACGSGGSFVSKARRRGVELLITGEATFHDCLEAESSGMVMGLLGHYHSERFAMEQWAEQIGEEVPELTVWPSVRESDPIRFV